MPTLSKQLNIDRREIIRALACFSTDRLLEMKSEFQDKVEQNLHLESESEVGRSSSSVLLADPIITLDCIFYVLNRRGRLSEEEQRDWLASRPRTQMRLILNPFRGNNL